MEQKSELDMDQLDKFKRRLIRSVAWMLVHQKMPESAVWIEMKKVMGCDCLQLWEHMRSLTQKKLKRLLAAEDRSLCIPEVARMSLTDWQLYDQVLVHEDIDVIGLHNMSPHKADSKVLIDLFALVQRFHIESKSGDKLADAWTAATVFYNSQGHQCSPMLLQKRWYQLKTETRRRFYEFWHSYRGSERQIPKAEQYRPTVLQRTLARRFPEVITGMFPDWETRIVESLVILPDEFESRKNMKVLPNPSDENSPDIVVMEPDIETIDLLQESDSEQENNQDDTAETNERDDPVTNMQIKVEPDDPVIDVSTIKEKINKTDVVMAQVVEEESLFDSMNDDIFEMAAEEQSLITIASNFESKLKEAESADTDDQFVPKITNVFGNVRMTDETLSIMDNLTKNSKDNVNTPVNDALVVNQSETNNEIEETTGEPICVRVDIVDSSGESDVETDSGRVEQQQTCFNNKGLIDTSLSTNLSDVKTNTLSYAPDDNENAVLSKLSDPNVSLIKNRTGDTDGGDVQKLQFGNLDLSSFGDIPDDLNFADDGIEFIDDSVADIDHSIVKVEEEDNQVQASKETDGTCTNTDDESNPNQEFKLDEKLFLDPVVYTQKLDDMCILKNKNINSINVEGLLSKLIEESKPISDRSVDAQKARIEKQRISLSNYMLQKPKNRKYNPIQLCKNPDFNTRLKRLTAGFLSSWQNRTLLKACKPLTIDLTKSFESKLINNTIYLKKPDNNSIVEIDEFEEKTSSVLPSVIPVQTLIDNTRFDDVFKLTNRYCSDTSNPEVEELLVERNKVIHLPDITQVRRINQSLLTAEVSPIQSKTSGNVSKLTVDTRSAYGDTRAILENKLNTNTVSTTALQINKSSGAYSDHLNVDKLLTTPDVDQEVTDKPVLKSSMLVQLLQTPARNPVFNNNTNDTCEYNQSEHFGVNIMAPTLTVENQNRNKLQKKSTVNSTKVAWRPTYCSKFQASWIERSKYPGVKHDEFLLTADTLHKLLHLFSGHNKEPPSGKKKPSKKNIEKKAKKEIEQKKDVHKKPKEGSDAKKWPRRLITKVVYKSTQCCWARERILHIQLKESQKRRTKHSCQYDKCTCCCREELARLLAGGNESGAPQSTEISWSHQPNVPDKSVTETVVTDNTSLQDTNVPTIASVYSLNPTPNTELRFDASSSIVPVEEPLKDISTNREKASSTTTVESLELNIPIIDETQMIYPKTNFTTLEKPAKKNIELNIPVCNNIKSPQSNVSSEEILAAPAIEHLKLNIPIYDETLLNNSKIDSQVTSTPAVENFNLNIPIRDETQSTKQTSHEVNIGDSVVDVTITISKKPNISVGALNEPGNLNKSIGKPGSIAISSFNQLNKNHITIDGTNQCINQKSEVLKVTSGMSQKEKILILNSKQMTKVPVGCPIFLGTNKILLTNVKLPSSTKETKPIINIPENTAPPLPLPYGVQLVLMSNSKLTYTVMPGVQLSPEDKAKMPALLETVEQQMNLPGIVSMTTATKSSIIPTNDEVVNISDDETSPTPEVVAFSNSPTTSIEVQKNKNDTNTNDSSEQIEVEIPKTDVIQMTENEVSSDEPQMQHSVTPTDVSNKNTAEFSQNSLHTLKDIGDQQSDIRENNLTVTSKTNSAQNTQTFIEYSSQPINNIDVINNDDESTTNIDVKENNESVSRSKKTILSDLMEMSGISAEDIAPVHVESREVEDTVPAFSNLMQRPILPPNNNLVQLPHELNTVSSFAELKYACQQNGQFYKLDFETGVVVPINVCVKKKLKSPSLGEVRIAPKNTIDLTDDVEISAENENTNVKTIVPPVIIRNERSLLRVSQTQMQNIKNLTMFKEVQRPRILKRVDKKSLPSHLQIIKTPIGRSREVRLVYRSPVSKETSTSPVRQKRKSLEDESISLSDSSDEEPLIKKVKRKQLEKQSQGNSNILIHFRKELEKRPDLGNKLSIGPEGDPTALIEDEIKLFEDPPDESLPMEDAGDEEDCILGV